MTKQLMSGKYFRWALFNLAIVATYGTLMRYKIAFNFPFLEQNNLLHAHSHFAFNGWISHVLYSGIALLLADFISTEQQRKFRFLIVFNLICAVGMLVSFTAQGYGMISLGFSTLSVFVAVFFAWAFIKDAKYFPTSHPARPWAIAGLLLNIISMGGPLLLAYMMAAKTINSQYYLGSEYYYLHFQYSGWFFFASMAMVVSHLKGYANKLRTYFWIFAVTVFPTFFLSILWVELPSWLYIITVMASLVQLIAWLHFLVKFWPVFKKNTVSSYPAWINLFFYGSAVAITLKFTLQAVSVIPSLSQLVFGIRPIVIGYLHLVLLGVYSLFFLGYIFAKGYAVSTRMAKWGAFGFFTGVILNELFLGTQGIMAFAYIPVPYINVMLLSASIVLFVSTVLLSVSQLRR